jgi:hypothetical protein
MIAPFDCYGCGHDHECEADPCYYVCPACIAEADQEAPAVLAQWNAMWN